MTIASGQDKPPVVLSLRRPWVAVTGLAILAFLTAGILAMVVYVRTMHRLEDYAALSARIAELRSQNERLSDLELELQELLTFQNRMMNLAGVQSALRIRTTPGDNLTGSFDPDSTGGSEFLVVWPVTGKRTKALGDSLTGVDIAALPGQTVMAAGAGVVMDVRAEPTRGYRLRIDHGDSLVTVYANVAECLVNVGTRVDAGQAIGRVGAGAEGDEGKLHFEVFEGGKAVPPEDFVRRLDRR